MKLVVAGTADDGRAVVVRNEPIGDGAFETLWKLDELPPEVKRPVSTDRYEMGIKPGEGVWMVVRHAPNTSTDRHRTDAISFSTILSGRIELLLDDESVELVAGDCLVLLGVMHGWKLGDEGATMIATALGLDPA
ncbi:hypothetical protein P3H15_44975 [Rhodococcus sp. T2V]|uniref:hypothetical protein n=1 Tax=Rhodococcus sp. T2V TaxID=3034164 RepID=UPI0023E2756D|nr:hypothetical protein [Rhodococcus sp. T2V]MDF3312130.1 hypothetical protein [Rhodococcus sp. T2V]